MSSGQEHKKDKSQLEIISRSAKVKNVEYQMTCWQTRRHRLLLLLLERLGTQCAPYQYLTKEQLIKNKYNHNSQPPNIELHCFTMKNTEVTNCFFLKMN
jgi:hypothetical protein